MSFFEFPHTRTYDSDLGFIIRWIKEEWPKITSIEEWIQNHEIEYNELVTRVNNILPELLAAIPPEVQMEVIRQLNNGTFENLIIETAQLITENYLRSLYDLNPIEALQTYNGEYILTVGGEYIIINAASAFDTAYTTNAISYFYGYVKNAMNKVLSGKKPKNNEQHFYLNEPPVLTLMHFSDYHGDNEELGYIYDDWGKIVSICDDWICTGDMCADRFHDDFSFFPNSTNIAVKSTLLTIGNHDAYYESTGYDQTQIASEQELYDKFFAPTIQNWGVVYQPGKTYYYKDYPNQLIRLIVLDDMLLGADAIAQRTWLEQTALNTTYSVVIAKHFRSPNSVPIPSVFTSIDWSGVSTGGGGNVTYIEDVVNTFINNGGHFICYMVGHTHFDMISYSADYPNQMAIAVDAAGRWVCNQTSDVMRYNDQISRDLFNVIQFDTSNGVVKLTRCGCNYDNRVREKNTLCIDYRTKEIIYQ